VRGTIVEDEDVVVAEREPPAEVHEEPGPAPGVEYVWIAGHWHWSGAEWVWHRGHWEVKRAGFEWAPGHWVRRPRGWLWVEGHWRRRP
jgi:hypothetical protein